MQFELTTANKIRLILAPVALTSVLFPELCHPALDRLWDVLLAWRVCHWSSFETIWTVFWYAAIEASMTVVFMRHPERRFVQPRGAGSMDEGGEEATSVQNGNDSIVEETTNLNETGPSENGSVGTTKENKRGVRIKGMRRPSRRIGEILTYIAPLLAMDFTMIKKFRDVPLERILESGGYSVPPVPPMPSNSTATSIPNSLPPKTFLIPTLHNFTSSSPLQLYRALPTHPPSSRRLVLELVASLIIYDALFFLFHLSLHAIPAFRVHHLKHHNHGRQINPQVTNQLGVVERLGLVMLANFSLNVIGAHVLTRMGFVVVFVWLLVEIHSGMETGWGYEKVLPRGWGGGAKGHWGHHVGRVGDGVREEGGYAPFFCWCDGVWAWCAVRRRENGAVGADRGT
ncbi:hypothetical protein MKZ38_001411 [Zalerion maritima]|uniref:Fatty acid hydroxylase domain-containing protein n=1 Tax=Zalerion maritima TaxID=339359 RepID=A0AAD5RQ79_9PEZI|nr:hypothetical protein MKZ38_001411 [Zalerion maritima]